MTEWGISFVLALGALGFLMLPVAIVMIAETSSTAKLVTIIVLALIILTIIARTVFFG